MAPIRLTESFYHRDCLEVAPDLVGKLLMRRLPDGTILQERIAETEAYRGHGMVTKIPQAISQAK